jgi:L-fuculose-phosphate aldolase
MQPTTIGIVRSHLKAREECPKYGHESLPPVWIELVPEFEAAASDLQVGDAVLILTWMHQGDQSVLRCHPRGNTGLPQRGVFSTRSPDRPTPIGLHPVRVTAREGLRLQVHPLEVMDGTPVIDIKPDNASKPGQAEFSSLVNPETGQAILDAGRDGWLRGLFAGFNGNVSMRQGNRIVITATGSAKGHLSPEDLAVVDLTTGQALATARASSELAVHLAVYRNQPRANAVVHTHPPKLITLSLRTSGALIDLPLFEGQAFAAKLTRVPAMQPGTPNLGQAVGLASQEFEAVFMDNHGLVCWAETMTGALGLAEELESLAGIALRNGP